MSSDITVGIVGAAAERHCLYLKDELNKQGAAAVILDTVAMPSFPLALRSSGSLDIDEAMVNRSRLSGYEAGYNGQPLHPVQVFFLRALFLPTPSFDAGEIQEQIEREGYVAYAAQRERYATWLSWLKCLTVHGKLLINPVDTLLLHFAKPYQVEMLRMAGIPVPDTLVTGNGDDVLSFSRDRDVIYKPVAGGAHCHLLKEADKQPERLKTLKYAPAMFQEYVPGKDIRVFVLDGRILGAFELEGEGVDYRAGQASVTPISISETVAELCIRACRTVGLLFSGVDLKMREDGSFVMLECNPSPMFEGFDRTSPISIVSQLAAYMIDQAHARQKIAIPR
ncbi:hypothetical protein PAECIP111893_02145 [Paenibacillus plantiphilus]|uniref:ATP-grasp domain-containing protein n=1 Tax=Paenibacillus plantiphilus TaxID=2905650 RepID=A0ABM9C6G1_9BACL|nr:ATP-dependent carboxylate-amine ligase [Paenibacillus plantiphilus]CAH1204118.1 hypothetical protein PAECIP111893_02145 [Paenibacillus plantiphilus]